MATVKPTDGMTIKEDCTFEPGVYVLPKGLTIAADNITIDGNGATLIGVDRKEAAIALEGCKGVTIKNVRMRDYYHGVAAKKCEQLTVQGCHITSTAEIEANTIFLYIWKPADEPYGGAICLVGCADCTITENDVQHQMNGIMTYDCSKLTVTWNNASYNSGFGIHLNNTSDSVFENNWADYCQRWEPRDKTDELPHGVMGYGAFGHMGADATGFLIINKSCRNVFRRNFARLGGDGFFLAGRNPKGEDVNCADNLFEYNDGSLSPNIAFEATFSSGNIFRNNWADRCNYGFWLGFSTKNIIENNRMLYNRQAGIAVENGSDFEVRGNDFQANTHGILIWSHYSEAFFETAPNNRTSHHWMIEGNKFTKNHYGIAIRADQDHGIRNLPEERAGKEELRPYEHVIRDNDIQDNRVGIQLVNCDKTTVEKNKLNANVEANIRQDDARDTTIGHNLGARGAYL